MSEALARPLLALARALNERTVSARDLVEEAIANHERNGAALNAYLLWTPARARQAADAADAAFAAGRSAGPLQGVPISLKDLFAAEGLPTFAGSNRRLPPEWEVDGPVVANMRRQLGIFMGKTHMVEFAFGGTGQNHHWGAPRNPWDAKVHRSAGGSSSGAGVSLLEGSALLAMGSDTAGSVRIPAAATGTVGVKVTLGRWSAAGVVPLSPTFDTPGLFGAQRRGCRLRLRRDRPGARQPAALSRAHRPARDRRRAHRHRRSVPVGRVRPRHRRGGEGRARRARREGRAAAPITPSPR